MPGAVPRLLLLIGLATGCTSTVEPIGTTGASDETDGASCADDPAACDVPRCDPLFQDCYPGEGCYPVGSTFDCAEPTDTQRVGEPCELGLECLPGTMCALGGSVPDCDTLGCCTEFCDLSSPTSSCKLASSGAVCVPFYADGEAPPELDSVGVCLLEGGSA